MSVGSRFPTSPFGNGLRTAAALCALVLLDRSAPWIMNRSDPSWFGTVFRAVQNPDLNRADRDEETAGYYEGLLEDGSREASRERFIGRAWALDAFGRGPERTPEYGRSRGDFLYYELKPGVEAVDAGATLETNSYGMADREYTRDKPPQTRRIAFIGDSLVRGLGAPVGDGLEALLERRLNEGPLGTGVRQVEILNFGVEAYRITQFVDVALEKAVKFDPDVYLVSLSPLTVYSTWSRHLADLVRGRIDFKYDFLRRLAIDARLRPTDNTRVVAAKLARFRLPIFRWALETVSAHARRHGAALVIVFIPNVTNTEGLLSDDYGGTRDLVNELGIPLVDLRDTFAAARLEEVRVSPTNSHPNARGYAMLCDRFVQRLAMEPTTLEILVGSR